MKVLASIIFLLFGSVSFAQENCAPSITKENVEGLLIETRDIYFPELADVSLRLDTFRSKAYFFQAQPIVKSLTRRRANRRYHVQVNLRLLECPPSMEALQAIMVHELEHVVDYTGWSSARLIKHGAKYSLSMKTKINYERATDHKVLAKGLHEGLAQYREWVYQWLSPKELLSKRRIYLTPEEIRASP